MWHTCIEALNRRAGLGYLNGFSIFDVQVSLHTILPLLFIINCANSCKTMSGNDFTGCDIMHEWVRRANICAAPTTILCKFEYEI